MIVAGSVPVAAFSLAAVLATVLPALVACASGAVFSSEAFGEELFVSSLALIGLSRAAPRPPSSALRRELGRPLFDAVPLDPPPDPFGVDVVGLRPPEGPLPPAPEPSPDAGDEAPNLWPREGDALLLEVELPPELGT